METKQKRNLTVYNADKPVQCTAPVKSCMECPYESCIFDDGNKRMMKRGEYRKHDNKV